MRGPANPPDFLTVDPASRSLTRGEGMSGDTQSYWLLSNDREIALGAHPTIVGRDIGCDFVVEGDPLVSRRHACFSISGGVPSVEDLGSRNGVYVDGQRIEALRKLRGRETVQVGGIQLRIEVRRAAWTGESTRQSPTRKSSETAETLSRDDETGRANVFTLLGGVAEKALKLGNSAEAVRVLRPALDMVLEEARHRGQLDLETHDMSLQFACRLADATARSEWLDYVFKLQTALKAPPPARTVDALYRLARRVRMNDLETLRQLVATLEARRRSFGASEKFLVSRLEGLIRIFQG